MAGKFSIEAQFGVKDRMSRPVSKMEKRIQRFTRRSMVGLKKMDRAFGAVGKGIKRAGLAIAAGVTAAAFAIKNIVSTGAEFEQAITDVGAVSLKSRGQIAELEKEALKLGASTKFTATEVAGAMEIMAKAGFTTTEILAGVPGVLDAAAASGSEIAEVADVVSSALKGMGLATSEATRVSDVFALASSKTNSTIVSLGESLKNVASTARQLNVPLEEVVAGVALLQDVGLDASVAGSALNVMLTKLAKPPAGVAKQMKKFGISFKDAKGDMLPFQEVIGNISEAAKRSGGNLDQVAFLAELVGLRGQKAASNLAKLFETGKLKELVGQLNNAEGSAKKMAELRMDTLTGDLLKLEAAADGVKIQLFGIKSPLRNIVKGMTMWIDKNKDIIVSGVQDFITDLVDNFESIVSWLKLIGEGLVAFVAMRVAIKTAQGALVVFHGLQKTWTGIQWAYAASVTGVKSAYVRLVAAMAVGKGAGAIVVAQTSFNAAMAAAPLTKMGAFATTMKAMAVSVRAFTLAILGPVGMVIAVGAIAFAITKWIAEVTGLDDALANLLGTSKNFNAGLRIIGKTLGIAGLVEVAEGNIRANRQIAEAAAGGGPAGRLAPLDPAAPAGAVAEQAAREAAARKKAQLALLPEAFRDEALARARAAAAQVVTPDERISKSVSETINTNREQVEIKVSTDAGTSAEVTKKPKRGGLKLQESGAF